jgi:hypothetical protein
MFCSTHELQSSSSLESRYKSIYDKLLQQNSKQQQQQDVSIQSNSEMNESDILLLQLAKQRYLSLSSYLFVLLTMDDCIE